MSQSLKKIEEFLGSFKCSPVVLFGQILNKQGFSRPDLRLDQAEILPLISLNTAFFYRQYSASAVGEDNTLCYSTNPERMLLGPQQVG